jgi:hypothetical protein
MEASEKSSIKVTAVFGFDSLKKPEEEVKRAEEKQKLLDAKRINQKRIKMIAKPKGGKPPEADKEMNKRGGAINRAEFVTALKDA